MEVLTLNGTASVQNLASHAAAAEALIGLGAYSSVAHKPIDVTTPLPPHLPRPAVNMAPAPAMAPPASSLPNSMPYFMPPPVTIPRQPLMHDPRYTNAPSSAPPGMPHLNSEALLRGNSILLSQLKPGAVSYQSMASWNALVHPRGHDVLAKPSQPAQAQVPAPAASAAMPPPRNVSMTPPPTVPPAAAAPTSQHSSPTHTVQPAASSVTPTASKKRRGREAAPKFSWVLLQCPTGKDEAPSGQAAATGEKPLKKLRGHSGFAWKPIN